MMGIGASDEQKPESFEFEMRLKNGEEEDPITQYINSDGDYIYDGQVITQSKLTVEPQNSEKVKIPEYSTLKPIVGKLTEKYEVYSTNTAEPIKEIAWNLTAKHRGAFKNKNTHVTITSGDAKLSFNFDYPYNEEESYEFNSEYQIKELRYVSIDGTNIKKFILLLAIFLNKLGLTLNPQIATQILQYEEKNEVTEVTLEKNSGLTNPGFITKFPEGRFGVTSWSNNPGRWLGWLGSTFYQLNIKATYNIKNYIQIEFFNPKNPAPYDRCNVLKLEYQQADIKDFTGAIMQFCDDVGIKDKDRYECVLSGINAKIKDQDTYNKYSQIIKQVFYKYDAPTVEMKLRDGRTGDPIVDRAFETKDLNSINQAYGIYSTSSDKETLEILSDPSSPLKKIRSFFQNKYTFVTITFGEAKMLFIFDYRKNRSGNEYSYSIYSFGHVGLTQANKPKFILLLQTFLAKKLVLNISDKSVWPNIQQQINSLNI